MPKKKGKSKKGKGKKGKKSKKETKQSDVPKDPMTPAYIPPPPVPRERLINLLKQHPVDEKEVHGYKVTDRILKHLTAAEIRDLIVVFELFDSNADGYINAKELRRAMRALGFKCSKEDAKDMISDVSVKGKSYITFVEFLEVIIDRQDDARDIYDEILQGFKMFDQDSTGSITLDNLKKICTDAGMKFAQRDLEEMIEEADINGDGKVDQSEFIRIMLQTNLF